MKFDFLDSATLLRHAQDEDVYDTLINQLNKDFGLANCTLDLSLQVRPNQLQNELKEKVYLLIMEKFNQYLNLLYVIDIPENAFQKISITDAVEVANQVSFLILERVLQKVQLKKKYS